MVQGKILAPAVARRAETDRRFRPWKAMTISQVLDRGAADFPERPLVICEDRTFSYSDIAAWSRRLAAGLIASGVEKRDHVAMVMANYPEFVAIKFAIARVGATCIPINYLFRAKELGYVLEQSDAKLLITMDRLRDNDYLSSLDELIPGWESAAGGEVFTNLRQVVVFSPEGDVRPGAVSLAALEAAATGAASVELERRETTADPQSYSDILYTSGTTGSPKGVLLRHDQIVRMAYSAAYQRAFEDGRRMAFPLPMYHVFGYMECLMAVIFVGGAIVPQVSFDAAAMLTGLSRHGVGEIVAVPAVTLPLIAEARRGTYDTSSVHTVFSSGGAAPPTIWEDIRSVFGSVEITTGYGMTETTAATTCTMPEGEDELLRTTNGQLRDAGAAGEPDLGGHLAIYKAVDLVTGADLPPGEQGHLLVRGVVVTDGYYKKPDETDLAFTDDGWFKTGDIGTIDADGHLVLTGRLKESFRVGGEMVMPKEIEAVLAEHPGVAEAHVVGIPHERMGEVACAWIIPRDPANPPEAEELSAYCAGRLARFKVPRHVICASLAELPLTATGRVQKFRLSEMAQQRLKQLTRA
jgi:fatty-acyl-CoA synthase